LSGHCEVFIVGSVHGRDVGCVLQLEVDWRHCVPELVPPKYQRGGDDRYVEQMNMMNQEGDCGDIVSLRVQKWVAEIKNQSHLIAGFNKDIEHWRKRELAAAILCGEHLVNIRKTYGNRGDGFKLFVETEFQMDFCYKTATRYMKLFHGKDRLKANEVSLRQAYITLGIVKYDGASSNDDTSPDKMDCDQSASGHNQSKSGKNKKASKRPKVEIDNDPKPDSILIPNYNKSSEMTGLLEFNFDSDGDIVGRHVGRSAQFKKLHPEGLDRILKHLEPYVAKRMAVSKRLLASSPECEMVVSLAE
jgi:hypothetical protein